MSTSWGLIKHYINSYPNGHVITRKNLIQYCNCASVDTYRRVLSIIGFIGNGNGGGEYVKILPIPDDLTWTKAKSVIINENSIKKYWRSLKIKEIILD